VTLTNAYLTSDEAIRYVGQNDVVDPDDLEDVVTAVSRMIDQHCQRHFWQTASIGRTFDVSAPMFRFQFGGFNDLVSIASLKFDTTGDGTFDTTVTNYILDAPPTGPEVRPFQSLSLLSGTSFPSASTGRTRLVEVSGVWGWPAVPLPVKQACRIQLGRIFKRVDSPTGTLGFGDFGVARVPSKLDPDVAEMLGPYRHVGAFGIA